MTSTTITKKNPMFAGFLSLFLGPIGYLYLGLNFFVAGITISIIISAVLYLLNFPLPTFFNYLQLLVYAYFAYKIAYIKNAFAEHGTSEENSFYKINSIGFAFYIMISVMMNIVRLYAFVIGIYFVAKLFSQGAIFWGVLALIFGIALIQYFLEGIFGLISMGIIKVFGIDKKYL